MYSKGEKKRHNKHEFYFIWLKRKSSYIINIPNPNSFVCWGCSNTQHAWTKSNISYPFTVLFKSRCLVKQFGAPQRNLNHTKQINDFINIPVWFTCRTNKSSPGFMTIFNSTNNSNKNKSFSLQPLNATILLKWISFIVKVRSICTYLVIMATSSKKFSIRREVTTLNFMWTCHYMLDLLENES